MVFRIVNKFDISMKNSWGSGCGKLSRAGLGCTVKECLNQGMNKKKYTGKYTCLFVYNFTVYNNNIVTTRILILSSFI